MSNISIVEKLNHLIDSSFHSHFYGTQVMVMEDETVWDMETHTLLVSVLTDELINLLHSEYSEWL